MTDDGAIVVSDMLDEAARFMLGLAPQGPPPNPAKRDHHKSGQRGACYFGRRATASLSTFPISVRTSGSHCVQIHSANSSFVSLWIT